jgi:broad specificity phosphatase PhoE
MKITFIRHIAVEKRYKNCFNGQIDVDIDYQELESEKFLNLKSKLKNTHFDKIYSSNLMRTQKTLEYLGFKYFIQSKLISEIKFKFEGKRFEELNLTKDALESKENWFKFITNESIDEFRYRVNDFLINLSGKNILISTHAGVIKMALAILENREFLDVFDMKIDNLDLIEVIKED